MTGELTAIGAALLLVLVPGAAAALALGLRGLALIGLAGPIGVALHAGLAVVLPLTGVPFAGWHALVLAALALSARVAVGRGRLRAPLARRELITVAAIAVSGAAAGALAFAGTPLTAVNSTYDGVFHLNGVAYILSTGNGSSIDLYRMTHPGTDPIEFYPAAWHDLVAATVQLSGASIPLATNSTWVAVTAAVWVPGVAYLAGTAFGQGGRLFTATLAAPLATAFAAAPYLLLDWGTLFPTGLAYALLPSGLALLISALGLVPEPQRPPWPALGTAAGMWTVAAGLSHPRSLFGMLVLALPLLAVAAGRVMAPRWATRGGRRRILLVSGAAVVLVAAVGLAGWLYVYRTFDLENRPIADHLNGGPATARQDVWASFLQALLNAPIVSPWETAVPPAWLLSALVLAALITAAARPDWRWAVAAWLLAVLLYCLAAGSNSDFAKLATGIWYKDKYRLISLLPVITAPLAAGTLALVARAATRRGVRRALVATGMAVTTGAVLASSWFGPGLTATRDAIATVNRVPDGVKNGALLNQDTLALLERLPDLSPPEAVIVGNPWNGSTLSWAVGRREALFPHLTGDWDPDRRTIADRLDAAGTDPEVCAALERLGARYLFTSDGLLWNGDTQAAAFAGIDRADPAALGEEIARVGSSALYRITACG